MSLPAFYQFTGKVEKSVNKNTSTRDCLKEA